MPKFKSDAISIDPDRKAGRPCLKGTRFTVSQFLAELEHRSVQQFSDELGLDRKIMLKVLRDLASMVEESATP